MSDNYRSCHKCNNEIPEADIEQDLSEYSNNICPACFEIQEPHHSLEEWVLRLNERIETLEQELKDRSIS